MTASAYKMAAGNYAIRIEDRSYGEVGQLTESFNTLAQSLEAASKVSQNLEQIRRDYVANISHELRTPLSSIRAVSETLLDSMVQTDEEKIKAYQRIWNESIRLQNLINDMLELSRLQSGQASLEKQAVNIGELLEQVHERFSEVGDDLGIELKQELDTKHIPLGMTNRNRIEQVLIILIDNAFKFTPDGGTVTISARWDDQDIFVRVRDTGPGISADDLSFIFDRFYKADKAHSEKGTGLGLAIAKQIMTALGETIQVASELGKGTSFTFSIKRAG
ncbi:MAG: HAMP domain-containing sensor histidine kinase, partial [Clostridia bacterium]|nr:HAMP domain-containing sensor histidine kinase [Clostridia bacterium]